VNSKYGVVPEVGAPVLAKPQPPHEFTPLVLPVVVVSMALPPPAPGEKLATALETFPAFQK
jgi:hypothetical protein